jgi:hypothetical protein
MSTKTRATMEDLYKIEGKAELVNGEIVEIPPAGDDPGRASLIVAARLLVHEERTGSGRACPDGTAAFMSTCPTGKPSILTRRIILVHQRAWSFLKGRRFLRLKYGASLTMARPPNGPCKRNAPTTSPAVPGRIGGGLYTRPRWFWRPTRRSLAGEDGMASATDASPQ